MLGAFKCFTNVLHSQLLHGSTSPGQRWSSIYVITVLFICCKVLIYVPSAGNWEDFTQFNLQNGESKDFQHK